MILDVIGRSLKWVEPHVCQDWQTRSQPRRMPELHCRKTSGVQRIGGRSRGGIRWSRGAVVWAGVTRLAHTIGSSSAAGIGPSASTCAHFARQPITSRQAVSCGQCGQGFVAGLWHGDVAWAECVAIAGLETAALAPIGATSKATSIARVPSTIVSILCDRFVIVRLCHRTEHRASYKPDSREPIVWSMHASAASRQNPAGYARWLLDHAEQQVRHRLAMNRLGSEVVVIAGYPKHCLRPAREPQVRIDHESLCQAAPYSCRHRRPARWGLQSPLIFFRPGV